MANTEARQTAAEEKTVEEPLSVISVEVIGYGDGPATEEEEDENGQSTESIPPAP
jgi:hypothetical protein